MYVSRLPPSFKHVHEHCSSSPPPRVHRIIPHANQPAFISNTAQKIANGARVALAKVASVLNSAASGIKNAVVAAYESMKGSNSEKNARPESEERLLQQDNKEALPSAKETDP